MTKLEMLLTVLAVALGTQITRWLPFLLFPENRQPPAVVRQLGQLLPPAVMGLLIVYCLRNLSFARTLTLHFGTAALTVPEIAPALLCIAVVAALQVWRKNTVLSVFAGTLLYMLLIQRA